MLAAELSITIEVGSVFLALFAGNPTNHYSRDSDGRYLLVERGIELADMERHLSGIAPGVLSIPILPNGNCNFAAIDADRHGDDDSPIDHVELARKITSLGLPLIVCKSKNPKSAHLWLFLKEKHGFSALTTQRLLEKYARMLGITGEVEIFPKQTELEEGQIGNGINLPLFGTERVAYGKDGEVLDLAGFIALAVERQSYGTALESRDLVDETGAPDSARDEEHAMYAATARKLHSDNLVTLHDSNAVGRWNDTLNTTAYFAARAFAAGALEGSEDDIQNGIRAVASAINGFNERQMETTLASGWKSGIVKPLQIIEDEFPERQETLEEFNKRFYVVENFGGRCCVCWETIDPTTGSLFLGHQSFKDFFNRFMHQQIQIGETERTTGRGENKKVLTEPEFQSKAEIWLHHPERRQYREIIFAPGEDLGADVRNLWRGFSVEAVKGDCSLYLAHVHDNICKGDRDKFNWLIRWMAWKVRNPGRKSYTCPVFKGTEGIGKNMCAEPFAHLFGAHALSVTRKEHLAGHFNAHLRACSVIIANEAFFAGDKQHESSLKGLITDDCFMIEAKGVDPIAGRNRLSIIVMSNETWVVPAGPEARRFSVFDCGDMHKEDTKYFNALQHQLDHGGYEALLHHLLHEVELADFDSRRCIRTEALAEQQSLSLRGVEALWYECLYRGELPGAQDGNVLRSERLLTWGKLQHRNRWEDITAEQLGLLFGINPRGVSKGMDFKKDRKSNKRGWQIPSLRTARALWDERRFKVNWPELEAVQTNFSKNGSKQKPHDPDNWVIVAVGDEKPKYNRRD